MKPIITTNSRPLRPALCTLLLCIAALWAMPPGARAQLYVSQISAPFSIGAYNATTGAVINANLIRGTATSPLGPWGLAVSGNTLFVTDFLGGKVGAYDATTGAAINVYFIPGLVGPRGIAVLGNTLFVTSSETVRTPAKVGAYNATTGAVQTAGSPERSLR